MLEQRGRFRWVRDRSVFVGNEGDVIDGSFGPGLPGIRDWTSQNFDFAGYVTGFEPTPPEDRGRLHAELGYRNGERVCVVGRWDFSTTAQHFALADSDELRLAPPVHAR